MYCNCFLEVKNKVAVVTEVEFTADKDHPVRIVSGYAINKKGKDICFWSLVNSDFVDELVEEWGF